MHKQIIIVRKDLNMSLAKMAVQCCHASMEFIKHLIKESYLLQEMGLEFHSQFDIFNADKISRYISWLLSDHTKIILQAKNKNKLLKVKELAAQCGLEENKDYFLIYDKCYTELTPEEPDGTTLTCIGFAPLKSEVAEQISKRFQLYR